MEAKAQHVSGTSPTPDTTTYQRLTVRLPELSVLASWDAEEYGMIGSIEWIEEHVNWLTETAVAYLNIDVAVSGPRVEVSASPELHKIGTEIFKKIVAPNKGLFNESLYESWQRDAGGDVGVLGSGSDYTGFVHTGINSVRVTHSRMHISTWELT